MGRGTTNGYVGRTERPADNASYDHARTMTLAVQQLLHMLGHGQREVRCAAAESSRLRSLH